MSKLLSAIWRRTIGPVYVRLFRRYFYATLERLNNIIGQLGDLRTMVTDHGAEVRTQSAVVRHHSAAVMDYGAELRRNMDDFSQRLAALETDVRTVIAARWEQEAIARRLAALEDRLQSPQNGGPKAGAPEAAAPEARAPEAGAPEAGEREAGEPAPPSA